MRAEPHKTNNPAFTDSLLDIAHDMCYNSKCHRARRWFRVPDEVNRKVITSHCIAKVRGDWGSNPPRSTKFITYSLLDKAKEVWYNKSIR